MHRRDVLTSMTALAIVGAIPKANAAVIKGLPWAAESSQPPTPFKEGGLVYLTSEEAETVGAIADRIIPADELSIGAKEAGCVAFIDRQLAGPFGSATTQYREGPFLEGTPSQGPQFTHTPAERYRLGLAALAQYCQTHEHTTFAQLTPERQDTLLRLLEAGTLPMPGMAANDSIGLFNLLLQNVREGYFSDPIYGGNKGMAGWKMLGFPGAQYDFRDVIGKRGQKLDIIPVSLIERDA